MTVFKNINKLNVIARDFKKKGFAKSYQKRGNLDNHLFNLFSKHKVQTSPHTLRGNANAPTVFPVDMLQTMKFDF